VQRHGASVGTENTLLGIDTVVISASRWSGVRSQQQQLQKDQVDEVASSIPPRFYFSD